MQPTLEQRWLLAMSALLTERNGDDHGRFGGAARPVGSGKAAYILSTAWGVYTESDAGRTLQWLADEGHRVDYAQQAETSPEAFLGWDFGRLANVAGWSYLAYLLDRETAWSWLQRAARVVQPAFRSFAEFQQSYLRGLEAWSGGRDNKSYEGGQAAVDAMAARPDSPLHVTWAVDAASAPPLDDTPATVRVAAGGSIAEAIAQAGQGGRVVLAPGVYAEGIASPHAVEIVAERDGEVSIEPRDGRNALRVNRGGSVFLRGLRLRGNPAPDESTRNAVHVSSGFAHLERCDIQACHHGVALADDGDVHLFRCVVHDCAKSGVNAENGNPILFSTRIERVGANGIARAAGKQAAVLEDVDVSETREAGIAAAGEVVVRRTRVRTAGPYGLVATGSVTAADSTFEGGAVSAVAVANDGQLEMTGCTVGGSAQANVDVGKGTAMLRKTSVRGVAQFGVIVRAGSSAKLVEVEAVDHTEGNVFVLQGGTVIGDRCVFRGASVGVWTQGGGGRFARCTIEGARDAGVQLAGVAPIVFHDCVVRGCSSGGVALEAGASGRFSRCTVERCAGPGFELAAGSRVVLEDCVSVGNGAPDATQGANAMVLPGAKTDAAPLVVQRGDTVAVQLTDNAAFARALAGRGGAPVEAEPRARALVEACSEAVGDGAALGFDLNNDILLVQAGSPAELALARDALVATLGDTTVLRAYVDRVETIAAMAGEEQ
jgi:hypothetical protein